MEERREKLEKLAAEMRLTSTTPAACPGWRVGRTDMQSHTGDGRPEHYAYPPPGMGGWRVRFVDDDPDDALARALAFATYMRDGGAIPDFEVVGDVYPIDTGQLGYESEMVKVDDLPRHDDDDHVILDEDVFCDTFGPEEDENGDLYVQRHWGEGYDDLMSKAAGEGRLWTLLDCEGELWLAHGNHYVNRLYYVITRVGLDPGKSHVEVDFN